MVSTYLVLQLPSGYTQYLQRVAKEMNYKSEEKAVLLK
jgi:hypothetical protein